MINEDRYCYTYIYYIDIVDFGVMFHLNTHILMSIYKLWQLNYLESKDWAPLVYVQIQI